MTTESQSMTLWYSTGKIALAITGCALFVSAGLWMVTADLSESRRGFLAPYVGWASIAFFGTGALAMLWKLFFGAKVALVHSITGFTYAAYSPDEIPWGFVADISSIRFGRNWFVAIRLLPEARYKIRRHQMNRFANRADFALTGFEILLNANVLTVSHEQLYSMLRDQWLAAGASQSPTGPAGSRPL